MEEEKLRGHMLGIIAAEGADYESRGRLWRPGTEQALPVLPRECEQLFELKTKFASNQQPTGASTSHHRRPQALGGWEEVREDNPFPSYGCAKSRLVPTRIRAIYGQRRRSLKKQTAPNTQGYLSLAKEAVHDSPYHGQAANEGPADGYPRLRPETHDVRHESLPVCIHESDSNVPHDSDCKAYDKNLWSTYYITSNPHTAYPERQNYHESRGVPTAGGYNGLKETANGYQNGKGIGAGGSMKKGGQGRGNPKEGREREKTGAEQRPNTGNRHEKPYNPETKLGTGEGWLPPQTAQAKTRSSNDWKQERPMRLSTPQVAGEKRPESRYNHATVCAGLNNGREKSPDYPFSSCAVLLWG